MPVPDQNPVISYVANGVTRVFPFTFYVILAVDLEVSLNGKVTGSGYTINGLGNEGGGEIVFLTPPASGTKIRLLRNVPAVRFTDYQENGDLLAETVDRDFDRLWMAIRYGYLRLDHCLRRAIPDGNWDAENRPVNRLAEPSQPQDAVTKKYADAYFDRTLRVPEAWVDMLPSAADRADRLLAFRYDGQPFMSVPKTGDDFTALMLKFIRPDGGRWIGYKDTTVEDYLNQLVTHDDTLTGKGDKKSPLKCREATLEVNGVTRLTDLTKKDDERSNSIALTPAGLKAVVSGFLLPVGAIVAWGTSTAPPGWLELNGQAFDRAKNPKLLALYPAGYVPDWRGRFVRGWAHGSGVDPDSGRAILSVQAQSDLNHYHLTGQFTSQTGYHADDNNFPLRAQKWEGESYRAKTVQGYVGGTEYRQVPGQVAGEVSSSSNPRWQASGESPTPPELRPANVAAMFIIKTDGADSIEQKPTPVNLLVSPETVTGVVGGTQALTATVLPSDLAGAYPVSWKSSNPAVATVSQSGVVNFVTAGQADIIASISSGLVARARLTVHTVLTALALGGIVTMKVGETQQLKVIKTPSTATEPLTFTVDRPDICTVSDGGELIGRAAGKYQVTATGAISKIKSASMTGEIRAVNNFAAVGSYAFLRVDGATVSPEIKPGDIVAGSRMVFTGTTTSSGTPKVTGTWECCGYILNVREATVFRRVS